jgi:1,2-phenylacetyl-CoA epoxidase catalytic subunit
VSALGPEARALLARMLRSQAYRELGAVRLFEAAAPLAPDEAARRELGAHAAEERAHLAAVLALWGELSGRTERELAAEADRRLGERPLPPVDAWVHVALARFLYDRAGAWQLRELRDCRYRPYARLAAGIVEDEAGHQEAGARALVALCAAPAARTVASAALAAWLRVALLSFGRPGSADDARAVALGLKGRRAEAVVRDFLAEVRPPIRRAGLAWPPARELGLDLPPDLEW